MPQVFVMFWGRRGRRQVFNFPSCQFSMFKVFCQDSVFKTGRLCCETVIQFCRSTGCC